VRVLIACEFSGIVRDAFKAKGHDAWSCDLLPTERPGQHIQGDVLEILNGLVVCPNCGQLCIVDDNSIRCNCCEKLWPMNYLKVKKWDLMIAHPPCTYLSYAGTRSWNDKGRIKKRLDGLDFFRQIWEAPINKICIENPKGCASPTIAKYSQIVQPWYWGEPYYKTTCLWLKNLPLLTHAKTETFFEEKTSSGKPEPIYISPKTGARVHWVVALGGGKGHERSRFWISIAQAMADQWG
jgi:hypothetical protein